MNDGFRWQVWGGLVAVCLSCSEQAARPDLVGDCEAEDCENYPGYVPGSIGAGSGAAGSGGQGGGGGLPPPQAGTLAGTVSTVSQPDLSDSNELDAAVEVRARGADDSEVSVDVEDDGTFRLEGVAATAPLWVAVGTFDAGTQSPVMDTLQAVDATAAGFSELRVMRRGVMDQIASIAYMSTLLELDPGRGHIIMQFVDADGRSLEGVQVVSPVPPDGNVAYDAGPVYSDQQEQTSTRGTAVLANVPAATYPGGSLVVTARLDAVNYTTEVRVARGAVTLASAIIGPQP